VTHFLRKLSFLALTVFLFPFTPTPSTVLSAQERPREFGIDGAISLTLREDTGDVGSSTIQSWAFPVQRIRMGQWIGRGFQAQISTGFSVADFGDISTVRFALGLTGIYHITGDGPRSGMFVSLGTGMDLLSSSGTDVQWSGVAGLGVKVPAGSRFAFKSAIEVGRALRSDRRLAATTVAGLFGVSVFTGPDGNR
jgi:hypothetical protein